MNSDELPYKIISQVKGIDAVCFYKEDIYYSEDTPSIGFCYYKNKEGEVIYIDFVDYPRTTITKYNSPASLSSKYWEVRITYINSSGYFTDWTYHYFAHTKIKQ